MKNTVYFPQPRITQPDWGKNPSIVFDQKCISDVWGQERLLCESACGNEDLGQDHLLCENVSSDKGLGQEQLLFGSACNDKDLGQERLLCQSTCGSEDLIFDALKPVVDWETLNEEVWADIILPNVNATIASPPFSKEDIHIPMLSPVRSRKPSISERTRKPSISDIIDVLNLKDEGILSWESPCSRKFPLETTGSLLDTADTKNTVLNIKNDDVDSGYSDSSNRESPSIGSSSSEEYSPCWQLNPPERSPSYSLSGHSVKQKNCDTDSYYCLDYPAEINELDNKDEKPIKGMLTSTTNDKNPLTTAFGDHLSKSQLLNDENVLKPESGNETKLSIEAASSLLNSKDEAIIIVLEEDKTVKYMSTSRQKLENFLTSEPPQVDSLQDKERTLLSERPSADTNLLDSFSISGFRDDNVIHSQPVKRRRGRKRIHEPDKPEAERGDKKRERNNEACRKFRRVRKIVQKDLFQQESILLQHNLNLKEQVAALTRQLVYIKEKLCMQD